jgi:transposase InsO family protein
MRGVILTAWQPDYNHRRPRGTLGHMPHIEFAQRGQKSVQRSLKTQTDALRGNVSGEG